MDCVNFKNLPQIVDGMLNRAGVSDQVRKKIATAAGELKQVSGQVQNVEGSETQKTIFVGAGTTFGAFKFPPNSAQFESELVRAQDAGLIVSVLYWEVTNKPDMIEYMAVFAGEATSNRERY